MAEYIARLATTGPVDQGGTRVNITRAAIESISDQVNGDRCLPLISNHDPFCMPIGKIKEAWVEPFGAEYAVMARIHVEEDARSSIHARSGTELVYLDFVDAPKPFVRQFENLEQDLVTVSVDLANFDNTQDHAAFMDAVSRIDDKMSCSYLGRHSLEPEPLIRFVLEYPKLCTGLTVVGLWVLKRVEKFVRYTIDETLRKTADEIADLVSGKIKQIVSVYKECQSDDDRPILTEVVVRGNPDLILLTRVGRTEDFPSIDLSKLTTEMEKYGDLLQRAEEVTFARTGGDDWELQYLKTHTGEVFGTPECYNRSTEQLRGRRKRSESKK